MRKSKVAYNTAIESLTALEAALKEELKLAEAAKAKLALTRAQEILDFETAKEKSEVYRQRINKARNAIASANPVAFFNDVRLYDSLLKELKDAIEEYEPFREEYEKACRVESEKCKDYRRILDVRDDISDGLQRVRIVRYDLTYSTVPTMSFEARLELAEKVLSEST